jgi:hypothetical protein
MRAQPKTIKTPAIFFMVYFRGERAVERKRKAMKDHLCRMVQFIVFYLLLYYS